MGVHECVPALVWQCIFPGKCKPLNIQLNSHMSTTDRKNLLLLYIVTGVQIVLRYQLFANSLLQHAFSLLPFSQPHHGG